MRRYRSRHTYGNTVAAVYEQIRYSRRKHRRFFFFFVEIRYEIYRFFVYVTQHLQCKRRHTRFRITHCRRAVSVHRTEVTVSVDEHVSCRERLRKSYHCIVDRAVSVRVVLTHYFSDNTRRLFMRLVRRNAELAHSVEYSSVHGLESVAHIGKGSAYDNTHGVIYVRIFHFVMNFVLYHSLVFE